eukprot:TRINITY_DN9305_c0_g1_i3.p1 TRINITY_DN9305_c0_g1~~TRINITY_DN9305_c0_g1_i3.p1  ORF type:complete len:524 (+),score=144.09 TRINITY_DN9305_c0_g1_i3:541-2112(+)
MIGKTEVITDNLNPVFVRSVTIDYFFEERQEIRFAVYDIDDFNATASPEQNLLGHVDLYVHDIVTAPDSKLTRPIKNPFAPNERLGDLVVTGEEKKRGSSEVYRVLFEGESLEPEYVFYRLNRIGVGKSYIPIVESETCRKHKGTNKHVFKEITVYKSELLGSNENRKAMIEVFKWSRNGNHTSLGKYEFEITELMEKIPLQFGKAIVRAVKFDQSISYTFLDYILGGLEISLILAIDFTGSNGDPSDASSYHHFDPAKNQYLQAISSVGQILENYDSDKLFTVLGFGASIPGTLSNTSHCFALNGNIFSPEVPLLQGVVNTYKQVLSKLTFSGPTYFSGIINYVNRMIEYETIHRGQSKYYILLLMTDGIINDMQETVDQIVRASSLPLSIIIVGIGESDFSAMNVLDADEVPLYSQSLGKKMERDIVQFVPFLKFRKYPVELAKETLEEVPRQLLSYMRSKGIEPPKEGKAKIQKEIFFIEDRRQLTSQLVDMGYDLEKIDAILDKGLPEASVEAFIGFAN